MAPTEWTLSSFRPPGVQPFPLDWMESVSSRMLFELDPKTPILYVLPIENILGKLPVVELFLSDHESPVQGLTATVLREVGMVALCGMSTRGLWDGPVTSNVTRSHVFRHLISFL